MFLIEKFGYANFSGLIPGAHWDWLEYNTLVFRYLYLAKASIGSCKLSYQQTSGLRDVLCICLSIAAPRKSPQCLAEGLSTSTLQAAAPLVLVRPEAVGLLEDITTPSEPRSHC